MELVRPSEEGRTGDGGFCGRSYAFFEEVGKEGLILPAGGVTCFCTYNDMRHGAKETCLVGFVDVVACPKMILVYKQEYYFLFVIYPMHTVSYAYRIIHIIHTY